MKNTFLTPEQTLKRKLSEWFMSVALERRLTKDQILTLYLNDVSLGQRGSFAIHGVPEASRLFFSKDVTNLSLSEAATIAGVIQSPCACPLHQTDERRSRNSSFSPCGLRVHQPDAAERASREPLQMSSRALDGSAVLFRVTTSAGLLDKYRRRRSDRRLHDRGSHCSGSRRTRA